MPFKGMWFLITVLNKENAPRYVNSKFEFKNWLIVAESTIGCKEINTSLTQISPGAFLILLAILNLYNFHYKKANYYN